MLDGCLARIDAVDGAVNAVVARDDEAARAAALNSRRRWRDGTARALEGVPFGVKDIIDTAGVLTEAGSPLFAGNVPAADAAAVARLREAGAVMAAKTATPEFAFGDETGPGVRNPWGLDRGADRWAGGSSSGSAAALASGQLPLALGTDTGGSIRVPASYCGVAGLKPTFGRVPRDGVFGVSWTLDHTGPMARTVKDVALMLDVIADPSPAGAGAAAGPGRSGGRGARKGASPVAAARVGVRPVSRNRRGARKGASPVAGLRIGVEDGWISRGCSPGVLAARDDAVEELRRAGAEVFKVSVPHAEVAGTAAWVITVAEFAAHHDERLNRDELLDRGGPYTRSAARRLAAGDRISARDYLKALRARRLVQRDFDAVFARADAVVTPAAPTAAPVPAQFFADAASEGDRLWLDRVARSFLPFNITGMPALVAPVGLDDGLPVAVQVAARPHADALCLLVGAFLQQQCPLDRSG